MILVTGGAGFIGSNLLAGFEELSIGPIVVCDYKTAGGNCRNISKRNILDFIEPHDLFGFLENYRRRIEVIFHLGAISSTMETDAHIFAENNYKLSLNLWRWCANARVRFIYASSAATYGDGSKGFDDDRSLNSLSYLRPLNSYGRSKHLFDRRVSLQLEKGVSSPPQWSGLKFFNVYGPNEYHKGQQKSVIATNYTKVAAGGAIQLFKSYDENYRDGGQLRDFIWVEDCVRVMIWLLNNECVSGLFNVGTGNARSFADLANALFLALDVPPKIEYIEMPESIRERYQYFTQARMERLRAVGFVWPFTSLENGVARYVHEYLSQRDPYR